MTMVVTMHGVPPIGQFLRTDHVLIDITWR